MTESAGMDDDKRATVELLGLLSNSYPGNGMGGVLIYASVIGLVLSQSPTVKRMTLVRTIQRLCEQETGTDWLSLRCALTQALLDWEEPA
jgi:hypothetical protein